jgi:hypothetical protein
VLARALALEQGREGASSVLLEDPDTVSVLDMVKEKLSGQMAARLLEGSKEGAVRVCLDNLARLLQAATRKRSSRPPSLLSSLPGPTEGPAAGAEGGAGARLEIARAVAAALVGAGRADIPEPELEWLVEQLLRETAAAEPGTPAGEAARESLAGLERLRLEEERRSEARPEIELVEMVDVQEEEQEADELDGLTMEELQSLLGNFRNLSRQEQVTSDKQLKTSSLDGHDRLHASAGDPGP